jgi:hypothetical protein
MNFSRSFRASGLIVLGLLVLPTFAAAASIDGQRGSAGLSILFDATNLPSSPVLSGPSNASFINTTVPTLVTQANGFEVDDFNYGVKLSNTNPVDITWASFRTFKVVGNSGKIAVTEMLSTSIPAFSFSSGSVTLTFLDQIFSGNVNTESGSPIANSLLSKSVTYTSSPQIVSLSGNGPNPLPLLGPGIYSLEYKSTIHWVPLSSDAAPLLNVDSDYGANLAVPEPATFVLSLQAAAIGAWLWRRRHKAAVKE